MTETKLKKTIGNNIKKFRASLGLSQEKLAERSKIDCKHICNLEKGNANASISYLNKIAKGLGVNLFEIIPISIIDEKDNEIKGYIKLLLTKKTEMIRKEINVLVAIRDLLKK